MTDNTLSTGRKLSFAIGNIGGIAIGQSSILLLYAYYLLYLGIPLSPLGISVILVIYGIWDALNEPLIGHISDSTQSRWGRRKPFIAFGIIPLIIFSYLIYIPPVSSPVVCVIYLIVVLLIYETFVTMVITLWFSLFPELSLEQTERLTISKYLQIFGVLGLILGVGVAPLVAGSFESPLRGYSTMGAILGAIAALSMLPTIFFIRERKEYQIAKEEKLPFFESVIISLRNRSFLYFVLVQFLLQLSYSLVLSSLPLFFEGVLGLKAKDWSIQLLLIFVTVIPSLFVWVKIGDRKGTKFGLFLSMALFCAAFPLVFMVNSPGAMQGVLLLGGIGLAGLMLFPTVLLSDVIDEDQLTTHKRREGLFNGVSGVIVKLSNALSWLLVGIVLTLFHIDRSNLTPASLTSENELGLRMLVGFLPVLVILLGLYFLHRYPLAGDRLQTVKEQVRELNDRLARSGE
jgi:GPH family glycoside/pentoside/hexuronide:cation symporter